jgi:hypothetical protein
LIFPDLSLLNTIEKFCRNHQLDYIEGITAYCERNSIEVEIIADLIKKDPVFTAKMRTEAENLNFVKKTPGAKLPI